MVLDIPEIALYSLNRLPDARTGWGENPFNAPEEVFAFQQKCDVAASRSAPQVPPVASNKACSKAGPSSASRAASRT